MEYKYRLSESVRFKRELIRAKKRGLDVEELDFIVRKLRRDEPLDPKYKNSPHHNDRGNHPHHFVLLTASFIITSCAPPSISVTGDTRVNLAFSLISGRVNAPQLQNVDFILLSVSVTLSRKLPA